MVEETPHYHPLEGLGHGPIEMNVYVGTFLLLQCLNFSGI